MNALNPVMTLARRSTMCSDTSARDALECARSERAQELLRLVGISPERLNSYPHELTGGMRQRAVIASRWRSIAEIIIMDEPTTALDVVVQREILSEIAAAA